MEELVAILIGAGIVALMPLVPAFRPVVKAAVKGGLVLSGKTKGATDKVGQEWREVVNEAKMETQAGAEAEHETPAVVEPKAKPARKRQPARA